MVSPRSSLPVCLITGSGRQRVGASIARLAADKKYALAVHYNSSQEEASQFITQLQSQGCEADLYQGDLRDEHAVSALVNAVIARFGRIDLLVNCAAVWPKKTFTETVSADIQHCFAVNTLGTFLISKEVGLRMCGQEGGGHIVTIGDWATQRPYLDHSAYFISKGSIETLTKVLAVELAHRNPKVRVNCIAPGPVMVPDTVSAAEREEIASATLVKKLGSPDNIAQAVFALTENDFITGTVLTVDGGRSIYASGI